MPSFSAPGHEPVVVVDEGPLAGAWHDAVDAFVERVAPSGDVRPRSLADGPAVESAGAVFVVTDGSSAAWRGGAVHRLLAAWADTAVVTVVQLMPQEAWRQSVDTVEVTWRPSRTTAAARTSAAARTTAGMAWVETGLGRGTVVPGTVAVPVIETGDGWLRRWAGLLTGTAPVTLPALVTSPGYRPPARSPEPVTPADVVAEFRASRSRTAFGLAVRLAAAPLTDETIRAIHRSVPRANAGHLVEVLSSDLVRPCAATGSGAIRFEFADGIREGLLAFGHRDRTMAVQHIVEDALAASVPAVRGLAWRVREPSRVEPHPVDPADLPYLRVELAVHLALSGPHLVAARRLRHALG